MRKRYVDILKWNRDDVDLVTICNPVSECKTEGKKTFFHFLLVLSISLFSSTGSTPNQNGLGEIYLPSVMPEEFIDGDIDRSEFDKYLSGYGTNHATSVSCSFYGGTGNMVGGSSNLNDGPSTVEQFDGHKENGAGLPPNDYILMKSEPIYETIPAPVGSSLSSALADVRSVYYDC